MVFHTNGRGIQPAMIVLNNLAPVFLLILLGHVLSRFEMMPESFRKTSDQLVYFIFFPAMLFWKIGNAPAEALPWTLYKSVLLTILVGYVVSALAVRLYRIPEFKVGSFSQSCYRFNTYVAFAIVWNALGEPGIRELGILIGFMIPIINVLAVSTLIWYSGISMGLQTRLLLVLRALVSNPLILGCLAGMAYARSGWGIPVFLDNTLALAASVTLPLALLSIGGAMNLSSVQGNVGYSFLAAGIKLVLLPTLGYLLFLNFGVTGLSRQVGMIFFATPTSTALYVLSSQLNSDTKLASSAIVLSNLLGFFSLSIVLVMFL